MSDEYLIPPEDIYIPGLDRSLLGEQVVVTGIYGTKASGRLIGYVDLPSYIVEDENGHREVLAVSLTRVEAA